MYMLPVVMYSNMPLKIPTRLSYNKTVYPFVNNYTWLRITDIALREVSMLLNWEYICNIML